MTRCYGIEDEEDRKRKGGRRALSYGRLLLLFVPSVELVSLHDGTRPVFTTTLHCTFLPIELSLFYGERLARSGRQILSLQLMTVGEVNTWLQSLLAPYKRDYTMTCHALLRNAQDGRNSYIKASSKIRRRENSYRYRCTLIQIQVRYMRIVSRMQQAGWQRFEIELTVGSQAQIGRDYIRVMRDTEEREEIAVTCRSEFVSTSDEQQRRARKPDRCPGFQIQDASSDDDSSLLVV
ncbi:hypothetical protein Tco_0003961 [Tanacetum coccineum]